MQNSDSPCRRVSERMVQTLPVPDLQPGAATGTGEPAAAQQQPSPSAGTEPGAVGDRGEAAGARGRAQPAAARGEPAAGRPGTEQTPRLADRSTPVRDAQPAVRRALTSR